MAQKLTCLLEDSTIFFNFYFNFYFFRTVQQVQIPLNLPGHSFSFLKAELSARRLSSQDQGLAI